MLCDERERLWEEYNQALNAFTASVDELGRPSTPPNFALKIAATLETKAVCVAARLAWEEHLGRHGCDKNP